MTSRERVIAALNHKTPDKIPVDLASTCVSGISANAYWRLRKELGLPETTPKIFDMLEFITFIDDDVREKLGIDTVPLAFPVDTFGNSMFKTKEFVSPKGVKVLVSSGDEWDVMPDGSVVMYPQGDRSVPPSMRMLNTGTFFDNIMDRFPQFDEDDLRPLEDYKDDFSLISDENAEYLRKESERLYKDTDYAIIGAFPQALLGDAGMTPAPWSKHPKGIRRPEDWMMAHALYPEYLTAIFEMQTENTMKNLEIYRQAVGNRPQAVVISTSDYGTQKAEMISPKMFRELYKPFYKKIDDWVHANTTWKTFYHSCGSIYNLLPDYVDMGVDIINPLQLSAANMDGERLQREFQKDLVFWGGGVNTQKTLAFGTPEEVRSEVLERLELFSKDGGYVFNAIHCIQGDTKIENILAMFNAVKEFNGAR